MAKDCGQLARKWIASRRGRRLQTRNSSAAFYAYSDQHAVVIYMGMNDVNGKTGMPGVIEVTYPNDEKKLVIYTSAGATEELAMTPTGSSLVATVTQGQTVRQIVQLNGDLVMGVDLETASLASDLIVSALDKALLYTPYITQLPERLLDARSKHRKLVLGRADAARALRMNAVRANLNTLISGS